MAHSGNLPEEPMAKEPKIKRRQFLAGAAAAPALAAAATSKALAAAPQPARVTSVPPVPPNENVLPDGTPLTEKRSGSDFMVDVLKTLNIDYIASLPAATFR